MKDLNFKKIISTLVPLGVILIIISSCYPNSGTVYNSSLDTILTLYDESVDFTQFKTYSMSDTIINICDDPSSSDCIELDDKNDADDCYNPRHSTMSFPKHRTCA